MSNCTLDVSTKSAYLNDILNLTQHIKCEVKKKFDVDIELEIIVLGDEK